MNDISYFRFPLITGVHSFVFSVSLTASVIMDDLLMGGPSIENTTVDLVRRYEPHNICHSFEYDIVKLKLKLGYGIRLGEHVDKTVA